MENVVARHYQRLASDYDEFLFYSPDFVRTLTTKMIDKLELRESDVLVDLGCGTGIYARDILDQVPLEHPVVGVDPFGEMLAQIPDGAHIRPLAMDGLDFSRQQRSYDKVLIKETIHHISDRQELITNLFRRLPEGGVLLLVHVPPAVDYPLFDRALERCRQWHADPDELVRLLDEAGFVVERDQLVCRHAIPKHEYFTMVKNRYMSALSTFADDELEAGLKEMEERYADVDTLTFPDRFDYLTGRKS